MKLRGHISKSAPVRVLVSSAALTALVLGVVGPAGTPEAHGAGTRQRVFEKPAHVAYVAPPVEDRPNVLLITTDDQALTDMKWMPRTREWLARTGITFTNMLSPHPLCCPARAEMITGQFAQNNGVHTNAGPYGGLPALRDPDNTLAAWLQRDGYRTGMTGKFLNQYSARDGVPTGWDYWDATTSNAFGYTRFPMYNNGDPMLYQDAYSSDVVRDDTVDMIGDWAGPRPFFIWSSYYAPHGLCGTKNGGDVEGCANPPVPAPRDADLYPDAGAPSMKKPSFNEANVSDKPPAIRTLDPIDPDKALFLHRQRIRALKAVDDGVAATMEALQRAGELDSTVVLFTSDNGYLVGEHRYKGKILPYEEALRVPLLMSGPGIPADEVRTQTVTTVDLAPTILALTGTEPGRLVDGRSILPVVESPTAGAADPTVLIQAGGTAGNNSTTANPWMYRGVRTDRYTYTHWRTGFVELYDRQRDPYELRNVAGHAAYAKVAAELKQRTRQLKDCAGTVTCWRAFGPVPGPRS